MLKFPKNFLWGAATSAYQVEGNNTRSDWWIWEQEVEAARSGRACHHYERFEQDFDLAKTLHHNVHRLSVEWSRIEPQEGKFSWKEVRHYRAVILALRRRNILPIVTLHHFTNPIWFSRKGGWERRDSVKYFLRYCNFVVHTLAPHVHYWITINEPTVYISHAYLFGVWPPQATSIFRATRVTEHLAEAHVKAYDLIHGIYDELSLHKPAVSISQNVMAFVPRPGHRRNEFAAFLRDKIYNLGFLEKLMGYHILKREPMDFIGVNYYSRQMVEFGKFGPEQITAGKGRGRRGRIQKNSLGWDIYPRGLYEVLLGLKKYYLPVMITENGICTSDDKQRWKFIRDHLKYVHLAMTKGVNVMGYLYWSLLDNFEWDKGFTPRFGLIDVNYKTFKRTVRPSARKYAQVCKTGILR